MLFAMLHNTATNRFHPIVFRDAPLPGGADSNMQFRRYRSAGHHTDGFGTQDEAKTHIAEYCNTHGYTDTGRQYEWDGQDVPAITDFFEIPNACVR